MDDEKKSPKHSEGSNPSEFDALSELKDDFDPKKAQSLKNGDTEKNPVGPSDFELFYEQAKNPLDSDKTMQAIIFAYLDSDGCATKTFNSLYAKLQGVGIEEKEHDDINTEDRQRFEEKMYSLWKKNTLELTKDKKKKTTESGVDIDPLKFLLGDFIRNHPECKTESQLIEAMEELNDPSTHSQFIPAFQNFLQKANEEYQMSAETLMRHCLEENDWCIRDYPWTHVKSRYVEGNVAKNKPEIQHRFYLNADSSSVYAIVNAMVDEYSKEHVPYYFKFADDEERSDNIVIYSSTEDLIGNLKVLQNVKQKNPELAIHLNQPPILTGVIDGNIGYGAQPINAKESYNNLRCLIIYRAIRKTALEWAKSNCDSAVDWGDGKSEIFRKDFGKVFANEFKDYMLPRATWTKDGLYTYGFNEFDFKDGSSTLDNIAKFIAEQTPRAINSILNGEEVDMKARVRYEKVHQFGDSFFHDVLMKYSTSMALLNDPDFLNNVRHNIKEECPKNGIDKDKFVFDDWTLKSMGIKK